MEKINFTNYPNTDKPINAENLNQMQTNIENEIEGSKLKSAILVILNETTEVTLTGAWVQLKIPFNKVLRKLGDGFSLLNDGTVVASNDVKRFRATVGVRIAENLSRNILSAYNTLDGETISAFGSTNVNLNSILSSTEETLTLSNGSVKIGSCVSKVLISGVLRGYFQNNNTSNDYEVGCRINKNTSIARTIEFMIEKNTTKSVELITVAPFLLDVEENDVISLGIYSSTGNVSRQYLKNSYLTIEVIE